MSYDLKSFRLPRLGDRALNSVVALLENSYTRRLLEPVIVRETGLAHIREAVFTEPPSPSPLKHGGRAPSQSAAEASLRALESLPTGPSPHPGIMDFVRAYRDQQTRPTAVAERLIEAIQASNSGERSLNAVIFTMDQDIRRQARESEERLAAGQPRGLLEGVPVAVKDEVDAVPYSTTAGTQVYGQDASAEQDATVVARLRAQGAIILGKTNMHEIGIGVTGANTHYGHCRNPYHPGHYAGGSSSGSAAAVAAGLCPVAVAADGGGSIRIPAALCGMTGLKPTYGRVSEHGAFPLCWSVAHVGPIGVSVDDVAIAYSIMAGVDPLDANTLNQPAVHLQDYLNSNLKDLKVGLFMPWFSHAQRPLVQNAQLAVEYLRAAGAKIQEVTIDQLELQRVAHAITISSEMLTAVSEAYHQQASRFSGDTRLALAIARYFSSEDYVRAQRMRTRATQLFDDVFRKIDVLITPTTGMVAPEIKAREESGEASLSTLTDLMRFCFPANLCGHPALTLPSGYSDEGLPTGVQLMGRHWQEHVLLRAGRVLEASHPRKAPVLSFSLLDRS